MTVAIRDDRISLIANDLVVPDFSNAQLDRPVAVSLPTRDGFAPRSGRDVTPSSRSGGHRHAPQWSPVSGNVRSE